jgi:hypothetical protein
VSVAGDAPRKGRSRLLQGVLGVVVPVASVVLTYYLTSKLLGTVLVQEFGDVARQVVPLLISMAVGGIARQIMTGKS